MEVFQAISLKPFNSFGLDEQAAELVTVHSTDDLEELFRDNDEMPVLVLGGGSNILLTGPVKGLVVKNEILGIEEVKEDARYVYVRAGAGENWHRFVLYTIERGWGGLENLSLIPGSVGASPIQNIGAYGVELKDVFYELEAFDLQQKSVYTFSTNDCAFGYRDSIFKSKYKGRYIIQSVTFRLSKQPVFHTSYGAIRLALDKMGITEPTLRAVSDAVIQIRTSKLPDPALIGNAGSFFKNPTVSAAKFEQMKTLFPGMVGYANADCSEKLAAGWLIEQCGWKGFRRGDAGVHAAQALVLVNYGNARGHELQALAREIQQSVQDRFGVALETEVNAI